MPTIEAIRKRARRSRLMSASSQGTLAILECVLLTAPLRATRPQVFILGLPRSGTTLIYQYLTHRLKVAYFTSSVARYPGAPCAATLMDRLLHRSFPSDFQSHYGRTSSQLGPREAGAFWGRYFGFEAYVEAGASFTATSQKLHRTVTGLQALLGDAVFVNKNVKHQLRIGPLAEIFPDALFVRVRRDLPSVALSVLRSRYANLENPTSWWSVRPPDYEILKSLSVVDQIAGQLMSLSAKMDEDLQKLRPGRVLDVNYLDFCSAPDKLIDLLTTRIGPIPRLHSAVQAFPAVQNQPKTDEEAALLDRLEGLEELHR